ncbi:hypothetical protein BKA62DRAFT_721551 [Auriculariales sp. MPI-PUGE-AT-0066]|nr:hypothetical protein BKA62DRAFT_721551 [Auriculariales sp. MPI-PUGE-AT-0066]
MEQKSSSTATTRVTAADLPPELVFKILEDAGQLHIANELAFAASLQLICRTARRLLLPIIYFVVIVQIPSEFYVFPTDRRNRTWEFFISLLKDEYPVLRPFIKHLVFIGTLHVDPSDLINLDDLREWHLESISLESRDERNRVVELLRNITVRSFFAAPSGEGAMVMLLQIQCAENRHSVEDSPYYVRPLRLLEAVRVSIQITRGSANGEYYIGRHAARAFWDLPTQFLRAQIQPPNDPVTLRIQLTLEELDCIPAAIQLVEAVLHCPGLSVVLDLDTSSSAQSAKADALVQALKATQEISIEHRQKISICFSGASPCPAECLDYARQLRDGVDLWDNGRHLISF